MAKFLLLSMLAFSMLVNVAKAQVWGVKSNALYLATTTLNIGTEVALSPKISIEVMGMYNPFEYNDNRKIKMWGVQPEVRWWFCERFNGSFIGVHGHYADFNYGLKTNRYEGWLAGGGVTYGYQFVLGSRWNLETALGVGYARIHYDKYARSECGDYINTRNHNYFGPTKASISFIYFIK